MGSCASRVFGPAYLISEASMDDNHSSDNIFSQRNERRMSVLYNKE